MSPSNNLKLKLLYIIAIVTLGLAVGSEFVLWQYMKSVPINETIPATANMIDLMAPNQESSPIKLEKGSDAQKGDFSYDPFEQVKSVKA